jgi:nicotinate dehydrogenase subunit A
MGRHRPEAAAGVDAGSAERLASRWRWSRGIYPEVVANVAGGVTIRRMSINLRVNGRPHEVDVDPATPLLYILSDDLALNGPKFGCGLGQCGCCTVIVKGQAIRSCVTPVSSVADADITTLEGLGTVDKPHPIQQAFIDEQAMQCGFCVNGVIMTAKALLDRTPKASEPEIRQAMSDVLCRCGAHTRMLRAIKRYAEGRQ